LKSAPDTSYTAPMNRSYEVLKSIGLLAWVNEDKLEWLLERSLSYRYEADELIMDATSPTDGLYVIVSGQVRFTRAESQVSHLEVGNYFGELSLISKELRGSIVESISPSELLYISRKHFNGFAEEFPDPYAIIMTNLARELARMIRQLNAITALQQTASSER